MASDEISKDEEKRLSKLQREAGFAQLEPDDWIVITKVICKEVAVPCEEDYVERQARQSAAGNDPGKPRAD